MFSFLKYVVYIVVATLVLWLGIRYASQEIADSNARELIQSYGAPEAREAVSTARYVGDLDAALYDVGAYRHTLGARAMVALIAYQGAPWVCYVSYAGQLSGPSGPKEHTWSAAVPLDTAGLGGYSDDQALGMELLLRIKKALDPGREVVDPDGALHRLDTDNWETDGTEARMQAVRAWKEVLP